MSDFDSYDLYLTLLSPLSSQAHLAIFLCCRLPLLKLFKLLSYGISSWSSSKLSCWAWFCQRFLPRGVFFSPLSLYACSSWWFLWTCEWFQPASIFILFQFHHQFMAWRALIYALIQQLMHVNRVKSIVNLPCRGRSTMVLKFDRNFDKTLLIAFLLFYDFFRLR